jgi:hypothetical protein
MSMTGLEVEPHRIGPLGVVKQLGVDFVPTSARVHDLDKYRRHRLARKPSSLETKGYENVNTNLIVSAYYHRTCRPGS